MRIHFLGASVPLTKTFTSSEKQPYPLIKNFTSYSEEITTPIELHQAILAHADLGHCLLKGTLHHELANAPRAGSTITDDLSQWVCLDFDRHTQTDLNAELERLGLGDVSYVLQYSASHGLKDNAGTISAHVFMLVEKALPAPAYKAWLMELNLKHLRANLRLSRDKNQLSWPLDITTCQNDKLLYIAPPTFVKPLKDPLQQRISLVTKPLLRIPAIRIDSRHIDAIKKDARVALNTLRTAEGLDTRTAKTTVIGTYEVINNPNTATVTGIRETNDYIRLNINGGDSWAYWHPKDNYELIHDYKSNSSYRTKEFLPGYYADLQGKQQALTQTPTDNGDLILAFRDLKSAEYYNGLWNPGTKQLEMYRAKNETQLDHWMKSHGRVLGDFIPIWDIQYDPRGNWIVNEEKHRINTFQPSHYMGLTPNSTTQKEFPTIIGIIAHMLGADLELSTDRALVEHFLNWFACIFQRQHKPLTAWVCQGIEGTGKGYFINKIAMPLLGHKNVISVTVGNIEDQFNGWLEGKLLVLIDEVDVDDFREKGRVTARLRNYITEPTMPLRRMRQQTIDVPNHVSFIFSSNRPQPVYIPETDRRYNVGNFQSVKLAPPDDIIVSKELEAFAKYLLAHKVEIDEANKVMHTEARERIARLSLTSINETCNSIKAGDFDTLWLARPDERLMAEVGIVNEHTQNAQAYCMLMKNIAREAMTAPKQILTRDELLIILQYNVGNMPRTPNKFTSLLRHNGIETRQCRRGEYKTSGIDVTWKISSDVRHELKKLLKL